MTDTSTAPASGAPIAEQMNVGDVKTVHVTVDVGESEEVPAVTWTSTGAVLVQPDPEDPTTAKVYGNIGGNGTVRASVNFAGGHFEMVTDVVVSEPSVIPNNKIEFS